MKNCGEQVRYQIFLVLVKSKSPSLSGGWGRGTRWLVTEPILTEGGEPQSVVTSEDGKMRDFGQMGPD